MIKLAGAFLTAVLFWSCHTSASLTVSEPPQKGINTETSLELIAKNEGLTLDTSRMSRIKTNWFVAVKNQPYLYRATDKKNNIYLLDPHTQKKVKTGNLFDKGDYNQFVKSYGITLKNSTDVENYVEELTTLLLRRQMVKDKKELTDRFDDPSSLLPGLNSLLSIVQSRYGDGFDVVFYSTDNFYAYRTTLGLTTEAAIISYRDEKLDLTIPFAE